MTKRYKIVYKQVKNYVNVRSGVIFVCLKEKFRHPEEFNQHLSVESDSNIPVTITY